MAKMWGQLITKCVGHVTPLSQCRQPHQTSDPWPWTSTDPFEHLGHWYCPRMHEARRQSKSQAGSEKFEPYHRMSFKRNSIIVDAGFCQVVKCLFSGEATCCSNAPLICIALTLHQFAPHLSAQTRCAFSCKPFLAFLLWACTDDADALILKLAKTSLQLGFLTIDEI